MRASKEEDTWEEAMMVEVVASVQANLRGRSRAQSVHTETDSRRSKTRATTQNIWMRGVLLLVSEASATPGLTLAKLQNCGPRTAMVRSVGYHGFAV